MPAGVYDALCRADVVLVADGPTLHLDGRVPPALVPLARAAKPHLLVVASGRWRAELEHWPDDAADGWRERSAIREYEGGQTRDHAERAAFLEWREAVLASAAEWIGTEAEALGFVPIGAQRIIALAGLRAPAA
jgi:hypothetical protein